MLQLTPPSKLVGVDVAGNLARSAWQQGMDDEIEGNRCQGRRAKRALIMGNNRSSLSGLSMY